MSDFLVDLNPSRYQTSLSTLRNFVDIKRTGYLNVALLPPGGAEAIELQLRCSDLYVIGFRGQDGWYHMDGEEGGWGKGSGVGSNYNQLSSVGTVTTATLAGLRRLAEFRAGVALESGMIVVAAAAVSEACRFATVATYFTALTNGVIPSFDLRHLKQKYFLQWAARSGRNDNEILLKK